MAMSLEPFRCRGPRAPRCCWWQSGRRWTRRLWSRRGRRGGSGLCAHRRRSHGCRTSPRRPRRAAAFRSNPHATRLRKCCLLAGEGWASPRAGGARNRACLRARQSSQRCGPIEWSRRIDRRPERRPRGDASSRRSAGARQAARQAHRHAAQQVSRAKPLRRREGGGERHALPCATGLARTAHMRGVQLHCSARRGGMGCA
mmetsp:Transcript_77249/g.151534  ORF Transcript_77249/g.151534 Transcript_77249/m.151534 type:complete len:201 (-) Transcript_77249:4-606(-)